jgi:hypothetical protein
MTLNHYRNKPITHLGLALAKLTGEPAPSHRIIYDRVLRGVVPAEFINGRWYYDEANEAMIAVRLGLVPEARA